MDYQTWNGQGRPILPSASIRDQVTRLKATYPRAAHLLGWYANETHYRANPPQDHTPYSTDQWPLKVAANYPYVFATDIAHRPDLGLDCWPLFRYWLAEARAGRTPWRKYIIWQAKLYDVRNGWREQQSSGHYDHVHLSDRTDYRTTGIGSWSPTPRGTVLYLDDSAEGGHQRSQLNNIHNWSGEGVTLTREIAALVRAPTPVTIDPATLATALATPEFLNAIAKRVADVLWERGRE